MNLHFRTPINQPLRVVAKKFNQELFEYLTPAWAQASTKRFDGCKTGDEIHLELSIAGSTHEWVSVIRSHKDTEEEWTFTDEGQTLPWPLKKWTHTHRVLRINDFRAEIIDDIYYECATEALEKMIYPLMWATFSIRPDRYKKYFRN